MFSMFARSPRAGDGVRPGHREALGVDEIGDKGLSREFQKIGEGALLDDAAGAQKDEMIAQVRGFAQVMGDQDHGLLKLLKDIFEIGLQIGPDHGIQGAKGFVQEEDVGVQHQGPHEADPLALATGELDRVALQGGGREPGKGG